ncbi:MAG: hypothetical protein PWP40_104 [Rhodocyclaceae bacterium]|nr:hypothetical protein [Rhodocyclaceae bacterium]
MSTELARRAAAGDTSPEVSRWWCEAMRRHLDGDDLDQALRLDRASRLRERNRALKDAAALLAADDGPWRCACRLEAAIRRHEARIAPLLARDPATTLAPIDEALRRAFDTRQRVPTTARNLFDLIR